MHSGALATQGPVHVNPQLNVLVYQIFHGDSMLAHVSTAFLLMNFNRYASFPLTARKNCFPAEEREHPLILAMGRPLRPHTASDARRWGHFSHCPKRMTHPPGHQSAEAHAQALE